MSDVEYTAFRRWYRKSQERFAHGCFSDIEIAYSAWLAGKAYAAAKQSEKEGNDAQCSVSSGSHGALVHR
jgi:hypothetical protein